MAVIGRLVRNCALGRVTRYSRGIRDESRRRGVLDAPLSRGMTEL